MSGEACPLPGPPRDDELGAIEKMLRSRRIAVVGFSDDPSRPSFGIASYLLGHDYGVVPVNPNHTSVMGLKCYRSLGDVPGKVDVVNVFRRSEFCGDVVRDAIAINAGGVWLQSGIISSEAARLAREAGLPFVQNHCIMVEHMHRMRS
jgi:predicted CoA-binding protein